MRSEPEIRKQQVRAEPIAHLGKTGVVLVPALDLNKCELEGCARNLSNSDLTVR